MKYIQTSKYMGTFINTNRQFTGIVISVPRTLSDNSTMIVVFKDGDRHNEYGAASLLDTWQGYSLDHIEIACLVNTIDLVERVDNLKRMHTVEVE